jgi:hypothetical protein
MPLNLFKTFGRSSRDDDENFVQQGFRSKRGYPSIRRQVLTKGFRRNNEVGRIKLLIPDVLSSLLSTQAQEVVLPVLPPDFSRQEADIRGFDEESYVEVPGDFGEPSDHYTPSTHRTMPSDRRQEYPNRLYESSTHDFGRAPSAEDEYSDMDESPVPNNPRYPMGGYSGRNMVDDPVTFDPSVIARTESMDSRDNDHYMEDGRRHPAFSRTNSQVLIHSVPSCPHFYRIASITASSFNLFFKNPLRSFLKVP